MAATVDLERTTILGGNSYKLSGPELKLGDAAPDFEVVDASLQNVDLKKTGGGVRIFSVIPSLDTPVCDAQTKRFEEEANKTPDVKIFSVSMDLPFAQRRWCGNYGVSHVTMLSDHKTAAFGERYGTLIPDLRIESRALFVVDHNNTLKYVEYVREAGSHPDYQRALEAARQALS